MNNEYGLYLSYGKSIMKDPASRRRSVAASAIVMQFCLGTVYAWSIFKKPMMAANGWSETQTQYAFMVNSAMFAAAVAFGGTLVDRIAPRIIGSLGGILFGTGILLAGVANSIRSITLLIIAYGIITGLGGGFGYVTPIATLIRWFPDKRGQLTGLAVMGYGLGAFALGNIGPVLIMKYGVANTFYMWGLLSLAVVLTAALTLVNPPDGWSPDKDSSFIRLCHDPSSLIFFCRGRAYAPVLGPVDDALCQHHCRARPDIPTLAHSTGCHDQGLWRCNIR